jgi:epoxyqueuosine reductase
MIKELALSVGFDACGIAKADFLKEDADFLASWLSKNYHGDMSYLARNFEKRTDPRLLVPNCKSVIVVLLNYYPLVHQSQNAPQIAKYAYAKMDYHTVIKLKLKELRDKLIAHYDKDIVSENYQHSFVDSAPVLERRWAQRAGLGWIGKHTQLINPSFGSYCFIGVLLVNKELEYDLPMRSRCGTCSKCIDTCPTEALSDSGGLEARKCIAYLTIETKNPISEDLDSKLSCHALGCDICADVCPWNKKWAKAHTHNELQPIKDFLVWDYERWNNLSEYEFNSLFGTSAFTRLGYTKFKSNINKTKERMNI